jgi:translocation and assembly module TamA
MPLLLPIGTPLRAADAAEADRAGAVRVTIEGVDGAMRANVRALLAIAELEERGIVARLDPRNAERTVAVSELERRHRLAPQQIREALMPFGHYLPEIDAELVGSNDVFEARYRIDPGPPARLRNVDIRAEGEGADHAAVQAAIEAAGLEPGDRLDHRRYEAARTAMFDAAYGHGFLRAHWRTREIRVLPDRTQADIGLVLDTGPRFHFGAFTIETVRLDPDFVARFVEIEPGEPYDVRRLLGLQLTLNDSEYFSFVEIHADPDEADERHRIPVTVVTEPARPQRYTVGAGYGTDTGPRFNLGVLLRRLNDRGHRFRSDLQLSLIETALATRYEIPIRNVATDRLDFALTARQLEIGDADSTQYTASAGESVGWRGFRRRLYLQVQREEFEFGDMPTRAANLLYPGATLTRESRNDMIFPTRGYALEFDLRGGTSAVFSDVSFLRLRANARWVHPLARDVRLLLRADTGVLVTDGFAALPPSQRFFTGGDRSVRGYGYQDLGERNIAGDVIGGEYLLVGSAEVDYLFFGDFGAAVFVDAGDAFSGRFSPNVGAGAGLRWRSPIGMLRLDVAHPFDHEDAFRIHLSIGADL